MATSGQNHTLTFGIVLPAMILVLLAVVLFPSTAYPQTITFTYVHDCPPSDDCSFSNMYLACNVGGISGDLVKIAMLSSDVPGYTEPVPIGDGSLEWSSSPVTDSQDYGNLCYATYGDPGGDAGITGSVFGLPSGSPLLTARFFGGASSEYSNAHDVLAELFVGSIRVNAIDPTILANLGMAGLPNYGVGFLSDNFRGSPPHNYFYSVSVTFTPSALRVLHSFFEGNDGAYPVAGLTMDKDGNLYGTSAYGGRGSGTVFQLKHVASGWIFNTLYSFRGDSDGAYPYSKVIFGPDGSLYGTTTAGGDSSCSQNGCGTVFSLRPPPTACRTALCPWTETVLYRFKGGSDGANPWGEVSFDQAGNIYGTTFAGGGFNYCEGFRQLSCGVIYQLTPSNGSWTESVLLRFTGGGDGGQPESGLLFDQSGNLYGTTLTGGDFACNKHEVPGCGTVFQLAPSGPAWTENVLYQFQNSDGQPSGNLVFDLLGNLYGGADNVVFTLTPSSGTWTYGVIYPIGSHSVSIDTAGNLYGAGNGLYGAGSLFKLTPSDGNWNYSVLYDFTGGRDGNYPYGDLAFDAAGNLYGAADFGGDKNGGVVFELPHQ